MKIKNVFSEKIKRWTAMVLAAALVLEPAALLSSGITSFGGEQKFHVPTVTDEKPVEFINGSFEKFVDTGLVAANNWGYISQDDVPGWNAVPIDPANIGAVYADCIEFQRNSYIVDSVEGDFYAELNAQYPSYLYEICNTVPGSRVYYSFYHKAYPGYKDVMEFYLKAPDGTVPSKDPMEICSDVSQTGNKSDWTRYTGMYMVPDNQTKTEFGFKSVSSKSLESGESYPTRGNFLDDISLKTGAAVQVIKSSDKDITQNTSVGDTVTYTVYIVNNGETDASFATFTDTLGDDVTYAGNVKVNDTDAGESAAFDDSTDTLTVALPNIVSSGSEKIKVTYDVKINNFEGNGGSTHKVRNQASVHYNDYGYEDYEGNENGYMSYSNVHELPVTKPIATSSVAVRKVWSNDNQIVRPGSIQVELLRDGIAYGSPVTLDDSNNWSYVWTELINERLDERLVGSPSDYIEYDGDIETAASTGYTWTVQETAVPSGYKCETIKTGNNIFTITNTFSQSHSGGGTSGGGTKPKPVQNKEYEVIKTLMEGDDSPGSYNRYEIKVINKGNVALNGIRIRDYMPEYTYFSDCDDLGSYGIISGKEHVTWFIEELAEGETMNLWVEIQIDTCAEGSIYNTAMYELMDTTVAPDVNDPRNPGMSTEPSGRTDREGPDVSIIDERVRSEEELLKIMGWGTPHSLPKTGDPDNLIIWLMILFAGLGTMTFIIKKNRDN